jgi:hypothetical protein
MAYRPTCKRLNCQAYIQKVPQKYTLVANKPHRNADSRTAVGGELLQWDQHNAAAKPRCDDTLLLPYVSLDDTVLLPYVSLDA